MTDDKGKNMEERYAKVAEAIADASIGDFSSQIEIKEKDKFTDVEMGINLMIQSLKAEQEKTEQAFEELQHKVDTIQKQQLAIQELSTPVIEIWDKVITLPVIGIVDSKRSEEMMESILDKVVKTQSKCVIIDITGVDVVDTKTADHFIKMVKAVRLLGAECIITGINPDIAQTLTSIGVDMTQIKTMRSLQNGLKESFKILKIKVKEEGE